MLIDLWCALNSSFGGPLLAIVTVGGGISFGKALLSFPPKFTEGAVGERADRNAYRRNTMILGYVTVALAVLNVFFYIRVFGALRSGASACPSAAVLPEDYFKLYWFYGGVAFTALVGALFSYRMVQLNRLK